MGLWLFRWIVCWGLQHQNKEMWFSYTQRFWMAQWWGLFHTQILDMINNIITKYSWVSYDFMMPYMSASIYACVDKSQWNSSLFTLLQIQKHSFHRLLTFILTLLLKVLISQEREVCTSSILSFTLRLCLLATLEWGDGQKRYVTHIY